LAHDITITPIIMADAIRKIFFFSLFNLQSIMLVCLNFRQKYNVLGNDDSFEG